MNSNDMSADDVSATLYDVGFNHFFKAPSEMQRGDLIYLQGHSSPGF